RKSRTNMSATPAGERRRSSALLMVSSNRRWTVATRSADTAGAGDRRACRERRCTRVGEDTRLRGRTIVDLERGDAVMTSPFIRRIFKRKAKDGKRAARRD